MARRCMSWSMRVVDKSSVRYETMELNDPGLAGGIEAIPFIPEHLCLYPVTPAPPHVL